MSGTKNTNETIKQTRSLPCKLTPEEIMARGKKAAEVSGLKDGLKLQAKDAAAEFKAQVARADTELDLLFKQLRTGDEYREVSIEIVKNFRKKSVITTRMDSAVVIDERAMTGAEMQLSLQPKKPLPSVKDPSPKDEPKKGKK